MLDGDGEPLAGATVMIVESSAPHPDIAQITEEPGTFRFDGLRAGSYTIAAHLPDGRQSGARLTVTGEQHVEHDLKTPA